MKLDKALASSIGLQRESVIKTTKIYTGPKSRMGQKIGELPDDKKREFIQKYQSYQQDIINQFQI